MNLLGRFVYMLAKCEDVGIKHLNDWKAFIEYSIAMDLIYCDINDYNPSRKRNILILFDWIADIMTKKNLSHN